MKRRANGEGTIYQRKDGRWVAALSLDDGGRKVVYGSRRRDVDAKLAEMRDAQRKGLPLAGTNTTLAEFIPDWLGALTVARRRSRTIRRYEQLMRIHVLPALGRTRLCKLAPEQLQRLYRAKLDELEPTTVHHVHAALHRALAHAERLGLVVRNVADLVDAPAVERREMVTLSEDELQRLMQAATGDRLEALFVLALSTGMRLSELLGLRWRDLDLAARELHLRSTLDRYHGEMTFAEPKTKGSRRRIDLAGQAVDALRRHRVQQAEERFAAGSAWADHDLVFTGVVGEPVGDQTFRRAYYAALARAGLPKMRIHDGRHTVATILLGRGVHAKIVSEMLGHSRISTTMDLYSHVTPTMQREATSAMEKALGGGR